MNSRMVMTQGLCLLASLVLLAGCLETGVEPITGEPRVLPPASPGPLAPADSPEPEPAQTHPILPRVEVRSNPELEPCLGAVPADASPTKSVEPASGVLVDDAAHRLTITRTADQHLEVSLIASFNCCLAGIDKKSERAEDEGLLVLTIEPRMPDPCYCLCDREIRFDLSVSEIGQRGLDLALQTDERIGPYHLELPESLPR